MGGEKWGIGPLQLKKGISKTSHTEKREVTPEYDHAHI